MFVILGNNINRFNFKTPLKSTFTNYDLIGVFALGSGGWGGGGVVGTPWVKCCQKKYPDL